MSFANQDTVETVEEGYSLTNYSHVEKSATSSVKLGDFTGTKEFQWNVGSGQGWIPNRSYFKVSVELTVADDTAAASANGLAPALHHGLALSDNVCSNLFHTVTCKVGGKEISSQKNSSARTDILKNRMGYSSSLMKSVGFSGSMLDGNFGKRQKLIASDGKDLEWEARPIGQQVVGQIMTARVVPTFLNRDNGGVFNSNNFASDTGTNVNVNTLLAGAHTVATMTVVNADIKTSNPANDPYVASPGDIYVVNGAEYTVIFVTDATHATVIPAPPDDTKATQDVYRKVYKRTPEKNKLDLIWQPHIGIMEHAEPLLAGAYSMELSVDNDYQKNAVQAIIERTPALAFVAGGGDVGKYRFVINDIKWYAAIAATPVRQEKKIELTLYEMDIFSKPFSTPNGNLLDWTLPPTTYGIAIFTQTKKSRSSNVYPPSLFKQVGNIDERITNLQVNYGNVSKPTTNWASQYTSTVGGDTDNNNALLQRYRDTLDNVAKLYNEGGAESFSEWLERGPYFYFNWSKDETDRATNMQLQIDFPPGDVIDVGGANIYVVALHTKVVQMEVDRGFVLNVNVFYA